MIKLDNYKYEDLTKICSLNIYRSNTSKELFESQKIEYNNFSYDTLYKDKFNNYYIEYHSDVYYSGGILYIVSLIFDITKDNLKKYLDNNISIHEIIKVSNTIIFHDEEFDINSDTSEFHQIDFNEVIETNYYPQEYIVQTNEYKEEEKELYESIDKQQLLKELYN